MNKRYLVVAIMVVLLAFGGSAVAQKGDDRSKLPAQQTNQPQVAQTGWYNPYPDYFGIKMVSATDGWIVGAGGAIRRYDGTRWQPSSSPITQTLRAVDATPMEAWAVGDNNTAIRNTGGGWQAINSPAPANTRLVDVDIVAPGEAWLMGNTDDPQLLHYRNGSWIVATPSIISNSETLVEMDWISPTDGWLISQDKAYHYLNGSWAEVNLPSSGLTTIYMLNTNEGWIGGEFGINSPAVLHYVNGQWNGAASDKAAAQPNPVLYDNTYLIISFAPNSYCRVGSRVSSWDGSRTDFYECVGVQGVSSDILTTNSATNAISGVSYATIWTATDRGGIESQSGQPGVEYAAPPVSNKVQVLASGETWVQSVPTGGYQSPALLYRYHGTSWDYSNPPINYNRYEIDNATTFDFVNPNDGWQVRQRVDNTPPVLTPTLLSTRFYHYTGTTWLQTQEIAAAYNLKAMQMLSSTLGWAVGQHGGVYGSDIHPAVAVFSNSIWTVSELTNTVTGTLSAVSFSDAATGWAVGQPTVSSKPPLIYRYLSDTWQLTTFPYTDTILYSVYALAPDDDVWVGGNNSSLFHWDGSNWNRITVPLSQVLTIQMLSPTEGWAGGDGPLLHYQNDSWQPVVNPGGTVRSISMLNSSEGWVATDSGMIRYNTRCTDSYLDVPADYWARQYILNLSCRGIVGGTGGGNYSPNANATRIQFAKMISLARGWPLQYPATPSFSDVPASHPLYTYVETAKQNGAINGYSGTACTSRGVTSPCYLPDDSISRAQTVLIVVRAYGWATNTAGGPHFSDVPAGSFFYEVAETAYNRGIISGVGGGRFAPDANVTRAQISKVLSLALGQ